MDDNNEWAIPSPEKPELCETCRERPTVVEKPRGGEGNEDRIIPLCLICYGHYLLVRTLPENGPSIWSALAQAARDGSQDIINNGMEELKPLLYKALEAEDIADDKYVAVVSALWNAFSVMHRESQA